MTEYWNTLGFT